MRSPRGLTIIEVLIVIAILIAMASLVMPNVVGRFERRSFESTMQQIGAALLMARAHAQMTGRPVEVVYEPGDPDALRPREAQLTARHLDLRDPDVIESLRSEAQAAASDTPAFAGRPVDDVMPDLRDDPGAPEVDDRAIYEPWANHVLPRGVRVQATTPESLEAIASDAPLDDLLGADLRDEPRSREEVDRRVRLAVFLPDGSLLAGQVGWLVDTDERIARIEVNQWSGLATVQWIQTAAQAQAEIDRQEQDAEAQDERDDDLLEDTDDEAEFDPHDAIADEGDETDEADDVDEDSAGDS